MKKRMLMVCVALAASTIAVGAQQPAAPAAPQAPPTLLGGIQRSWDNVKRNVAEAAEKMPEANYSFKPTPDVRTFGEIVGHVAASNYGTCARVKGATAPPEAAAAEKATSKADLVKAIQGAGAYCDAVFASLTDESVVKPITVGQNQAIPANMLWGNTSHSNEHYGNLATYMRLKNLVPPSTERSQKPKPTAGND